MPYMQSLQILKVVVCLGISAMWLNAAEVFVQKVHLEPKTPDEDPQDFVRIAIDGQFYRCAHLSDWLLSPNLYGWDFVAVHPQGNAFGFVGCRVERCVDKEDKPFPHLTQELLDNQLRQLKPEGPRYEGNTPVIQEPVTSVEFEILRIEEKRVSKCRYRVSLVGDHIWIFCCEAAPRYFGPAYRTYGAFSGTFCKLET